MKTLILNGSPRKNGDTAGLLKLFTQQLQGEYKIVDAYYRKISACVDCRYCWKKKGCSIQDDMQEVYAYLEDCDNILLASPLYFAELTGPLLSVCSRFQTYFAATTIRKEELSWKQKKGAVLLVGGGMGTTDRAFTTARILLRGANVTEIAPLLLSHETDRIPAVEDEKIVQQLLALAEEWNQQAEGRENK